MRMSEKLKLTSGLLFCASALLMSRSVWAAEACTAVPTCATLGYTATTCNGFVSLKCPFDQSKLFCGSDRCESGYYKYSNTECILGNRKVIYSGSTAIGVAVSNNLAVAMTDEGDMKWDAAVAKCKAKTTGGKSWRLPTKDELVAMKYTFKPVYATLQLNGGSGHLGSYWSSAEYSSPTAWVVDPINGNTSNLHKVNHRDVRCVFAF